MRMGGTVHHGAILLDGSAKLPEGARVEIEVKTVNEAAQRDHYIHRTKENFL